MTESEAEVLSVATRRAAPTAGGVTVGDDHVRLLRDGSEAYPAMLAAIESARREIVMEFYWFGSDALGAQFCDALAERARAGVTVRLVFDAFGSAPVDLEMFERVAAAGAQVRAFHPILRFQRETSWWVFRDHRKVLVCDGEVGFTGGLNIGRPWASEAQGGEGWRDDMVEVRGPAARELRSLFYESWRRVLKRKERKQPALNPRDEAPLAPEPPRPVWALSNGRGWFARRQIRTTYLRWIMTAERSIDIVNAYFVPDRRTKRELVRAAKRGVQVRVMVPARGDVPFVQWAVEATLEKMTRLGVRAWAYTGAVLHSKTAVVDGRLSTIGSYNLDHRSIRYNLEVNIAVDSPEFGAIVRASIDRDIDRSPEWTYESLRKRGLLRRALGQFALLFSRFL